LQLGACRTTVVNSRTTADSPDSRTLQLDSSYVCRYVALKELHWLPVHYRIQFKLSLLMFKAHVRLCPQYLRDAVTLTKNSCSRYRLRSADTANYIVPTKFGEENFLCCWSDCLDLSLSPRI